jgi:hypothetical protein
MMVRVVKYTVDKTTSRFYSGTLQCQMQMQSRRNFAAVVVSMPWDQDADAAALLMMLKAGGKSGVAAERRMQCHHHHQRQQQQQIIPPTEIVEPIRSMARAIQVEPASVSSAIVLHGHQVVPPVETKPGID